MLEPTDSDGAVSKLQPWEQATAAKVEVERNDQSVAYMESPKKGQGKHNNVHITHCFPDRNFMDLDEGNRLPWQSPQYKTHIN